MGENHYLCISKYVAHSSDVKISRIVVGELINDTKLNYIFQTKNGVKRVSKKNVKVVISLDNVVPPIEAFVKRICEGLV